MKTDSSLIFIQTFVEEKENLNVPLIKLAVEQYLNFQEILPGTISFTDSNGIMVREEENECRTKKAKTGLFSK